MGGTLVFQQTNKLHLLVNLSVSCQIHSEMPMAPTVVRNRCSCILLLWSNDHHHHFFFLLLCRAAGMRFYDGMELRATMQHYKFWSVIAKGERVGSWAVRDVAATLTVQLSSQPPFAPSNTLYVRLCQYLYILYHVINPLLTLYIPTQYCRYYHVDFTFKLVIKID